MTSTTYRAFDGCNDTDGYLSWSRTTVNFRPIGTGDAPCASDAGGLQPAVASLEGELQASVIGETLTVRTGGQALVFHRKPAGPPYQSWLPYLPPE